MKSPDWEALNDLHFLLGPRISGLLNEALNAMILLDMPNTGVDSQVWRDRARAKLGNLLNLYEAWSALIQHKNGIKLPPAKLRPFTLQSILDWISVQLELMPPAVAPSEMTLQGHQASLQESILLLYSVGRTQGSNLHLSLEGRDNGFWFKVRFSRPKPLPTSAAGLLATFDTKKWISQDAAFEFTLANDFLALNQCPLEILWTKETKLGEFRFFVHQSGADVESAPGIPLSPDVEHAKWVANITRSMMPAPNTIWLPFDPEVTRPVEIVFAEDEAIEGIAPFKSPQPHESESALSVAGGEGSDDAHLNAEGSTLAATTAPEPREDLQELMTLGLKRGAQLLLELQTLDQNKPPVLVDNPTRPLPISSLPIDSMPKEHAIEPQTQIISVVIPEPTIPDLLKPREERTK